MDHFRVHEATEHLLDHLRVVREGDTFPGLTDATLHIKIRWRQPHGMKLGAVAPVATEEIGREAAHRVADILRMPFEVDVFRRGDTGMPKREQVEPAPAAA